MGGYKDPPRNDINVWRRALSDLLVLFDQPSRMEITRWARAAISGSCVTTMIVLPSPCKALEEIHDFHAGVAIERAGGFIGKQGLTDDY